jgi:hypothetical protein
MQYGAIDPYVLKSETDNVFSAITAANKKLVVYEKAGHESLQQNDPAKWQLEVRQFLHSAAR